MWEPRGHADMYGGWIGPPTTADGDLSVLFTHNAGFSTMCGHGVIALAKVVFDTGMIRGEPPESTLAIETPAGVVTAIATIRDDTVISTRFRNVPSFAVELDATISIPEMGEVRYDLAYGGAFYAYVDAPSLGVDLTDTGSLTSMGRLIKRAVSEQAGPSHPDHPDLGFLYGVIFTGPAQLGNHSRNVCVFADGEVDRSPTGTGVSGRLAILDAQGRLAENETVTIESIVGSTFSGRVSGRTTVGEHRAIIPEIEGQAHLTGRSELWIDPADPLGGGFLID